MVGFATHRYSDNRPVPPSVIAAWQLLGHSVYYKNPGADDPIVLLRPRLYRTQKVNYLIFIDRIEFLFDRSISNLNL